VECLVVGPDGPAKARWQLPTRAPWPGRATLASLKIIIMSTVGVSYTAVLAH
jgi:hypothetical protein